MATAVIENVVDIVRPAGEVFDFASDHMREAEWNPAMRSVRKLTDGPVGLGTQYEMEFVPGQPMVGTCDRFDRPRSWQVSGRTLGMDVALDGPRWTRTTDQSSACTRP
jgi:hypothetical protein